jgi:hypothetical protein
MNCSNSAQIASEYQNIYKNNYLKDYLDNFLEDMYIYKNTFIMPKNFLENKFSELRDITSSYKIKNYNGESNKFTLEKEFYTTLLDSFKEYQIKTTSERIDKINSELLEFERLTFVSDDLIDIQISEYNYYSDWLNILNK